jgi:hypothetical protein
MNAQSVPGIKALFHPKGWVPFSLGYSLTFFGVRSKFEGPTARKRDMLRASRLVRTSSDYQGR